MESKGDPERCAGRVAHVVRRYGVTSQTFVADSISEVERLGWESWIVTHGVENRAWFPHPPDNRILFARRPPLRRRLANRALLRAGFERRGDWLLPGIAAARPELVHAHFGWTGTDALPVARRLGLPLLVSFHGTDLTVYPQTERGRRELPRLLADVDHVTVVSRFLEAKLRALGYEGALEVAHMGVGVADIPFRPAPPPAPPTRLLFVGRQVERKGLHVLLRAFAAIHARHPDAVLDVIGDGPQRARNQAFARESGIAPRVAFHGARGKDEVLAAMRRAHVLTMPSIVTSSGEAEGSPVVTKEALAVGLPVLATDSGGTVETIPPSLRHEIVPENDPRALAAALEAILARRKEWAARARTGRKWVEEEFDSRRLARRMAAVYGELAAQPRRSRSGAAGG